MYLRPNFNNNQISSGFCFYDKNAYSILTDDV